MKQQTKLNVQTRSIQTILAGFVALMIAMGIGRFSYTSILPLMQTQAHLTVTQASYLASSNYLGYLLGGFGAGWISWGTKRSLNLRIQLFISILTTGLMGLSSSIAIWMTLRLVSGISSGLIFVLSSSLVMDALLNENRTKWIGLFYGGVGGGIALTGLTVPVLNIYTWRGAWIGLMLIGLVLVAVPWALIREQKTQPRQADPSDAAPRLRESMFNWLLAAYGLEGLGYIVSATFLVALVNQMPNLHSFAQYSWVIVGVAAVPSTALWSRWAERTGYIHALSIAYTLQTVGVILPVMVPDWLGVTLGSILFGGTFMGITTLATTSARLMRPAQGGQAIAVMTGFFGIGQIVGPLGAGLAAGATHSYRLSLILASLVLLFAVALLGTGLVLTNRIKAWHQ